MLNPTTRTATITLLSIIALAVSVTAQTHKLVRFLVDPITQEIVIADNLGITPAIRDTGSFRLYFEPTANVSPNFQVHVSCVGAAVSYSMESPGTDSFDLFLNKFAVTGGALTLEPYDPDQLCTISLDWVDE